MVKEKLISHQTEIVITIPENYLDKEIEITVELAENQKKNDIFERFFGVLSLNDLDNEIENIRSEWDRTL